MNQIQTVSRHAASCSRMLLNGLAAQSLCRTSLVLRGLSRDALFGALFSADARMSPSIIVLSKITSMSHRPGRVSWLLMLVC